MENKQFLVLEASAGSGKTFALALRYVYLLLEGAKINEILALTFTNKAVDEMRQRIGLFLSILGSEIYAKDSKREELLNALYKEYGWEREKVLSLMPRLLEAYWTQGVKILTLDAFFNSILKRFCWYVGVPHDFEMREFDVEKIQEKFIQSLSLKQKNKLISICLHHHKSLNSVLEKIDFVRERFLDSLDAIQSVQENLKTLQEEALQKARVIQALVRGNPSSSARALDAVSFANFEELLERGKTWISKGSEYSFFKKLGLNQEAFDELKEKILVILLLKEKEFLSFLKETCLLYQKARDFYTKQDNVLNFSDVMLKTFDLLCKDHLSRDFFYFRLDDRISHILLDEFQDTSVMQYKILLPILEEILSGTGRIGNRSLFAVGDKKQSIYQFRGGFGGLLDSIKNLSREIRTANLDTNYRSHSEIVNFVNEVFSSQIEGYFPQKSHKQGGFVQVCDVLDLTEDKDQTKVFECVKEVIDGLLSHGVLLDEIAILAFKNADVMNLGDYLKRYYSPISTKESIALSQKRDAQILLSSLIYSISPSELEKKRLAKLLGYGLEDEIEILPFEGGNLGVYIYRAMRFYKLSSKVAKQVLEIACLSQNIQDFFEKIEACTDSKEEQRGLKILTIHASKGLEFEHLIVLDRLGSPSVRGDLFFCQYDKELNGQIFMTDSKRKMLDPFFSRVCEKEEKKREEEKKNLLYVALTRACKSLSIIPIQKSRGKSEFECIGLVRDCSVLVPKSRGKIEASNQEVHHHTQEIFVHQENFGRQDGYIQKENQNSKVANVLALKRGEAFHRALELYLGHGIGENELKHFLRNVYGVWLLESEIEEFFGSFEKIKNLLKLNFDSSQIKSEVSFIQNFKMYRIDCLLLCMDKVGNLSRVVVLDYKSGQKNAEHYKQVQDYVDFVQTQYAGVKVEGYLLYLQNFELVYVK